MSSANLPALPPLLCSTPPPIDFGEEDEDDSNLPSALSLDDEEDMFGDFANVDTNDGGESADANADVPSLPQTPVHTDSPPFSTLCFEDQGYNSPPPLEEQDSPNCTDKQVNKPTAQSKVKPIEAFNLNVTLGVAAAAETIPADNEIPTNEHIQNDAVLAMAPAEVEPDSVSPLSPKETETPPPCSPPSTDDDLNFFSEIAEDAWPQREGTQSDYNNKTIESCEQITNEVAEEKTKEATSVTSEMFSCSSRGSGSGNDSVILEDIADDSSDDERHSPKKHKSLILVADENSAEFFAIHPLSSGASEGASGHHDTLKTTQLQEDLHSTSAADVAAVQISSTTNSQNEKEIHDEDADDFDDFACFDTKAAPNFISKQDTASVFSSSDENANAFEANFSQFSDFNSTSQPQSAQPLPSDAPLVVDNQDEKNENTAAQETTTFATSNTDVNCDAEDDDFEDDDFQEFCAAPPEISQPQASTATNSDDNSQSDSCDDFGDFSEATFGTVSGPLTPSTPTTATLQYASSTDSQVLATTTTTPATALNQSNINVRLKPVLEMMFPTAAINEDDKNDDKDAKILLTEKLQPSYISQITTSNNSRGLQLESIDSARALDYHWTKSEMRHALIKSLGIDSRNILFGEKWNSSMPRFAANLSFNPLKPMKPTTTTGSEGGSAMTQPHQMQQQSNDANGPARGVDVPAVEFDWTSSGLVNPLDASHVHTLLLDLDQLVVVANLDNINLDSSSCCSSSPCATLEIQPQPPHQQQQKQQQLKCTTSKNYFNASSTNFLSAAAKTTKSFFAGSPSLSSPPSTRPPCSHRNGNAINDTTTTTITVSASCNTCDLLPHSLPLADKQLIACNDKITTNTPCSTTVMSIPNSSKSKTKTESTSTATNHHNLPPELNKCLQPHSTFATTTTFDHYEKLPPTTKNSVTIVNTHGPSPPSNSLTIDQYSDCRPKEDLRTREAEAFHASQSGRSIADAAAAASSSQSPSLGPAADGGQESHSTDADLIGGSRGGDVDANCSSADRATAAATTSGTAAATTLPTTVPADSVGNGIHNNGNHTHLGYLSSGIFAVTTERNADDVMIIDAEKEKALAHPVAGNVGDNSDDDDDGDCDEVVATSTFSGPLKETHIYTPSKGEGGNGCAVAKSVARSGGGGGNQPTKVSPIDFDYEIAAAGIIIDETVVKKEYRDVEYNPGFGLQFSRTSPPALQVASVDVGAAASLSKPLAEISTAFAGIEIAEGSTFTANRTAEFDDEFSDFQSVAATTIIVSSSAASTFSRSTTSADNVQSAPPQPMAVTKVRENSTISRTGTPTFGDQMILSPAILLPQAINIDSGKPKIEWGGDSLSSINPEELARIEELFPQPLAKHAAAAKTKEAMTNNSQRSTPTHDGQKQTLSISAAIAHKEQQQSCANDDDDWSEFVSVPAAAAASAAQVSGPANDSTATKMHSNNSNNNHVTAYQRHSSPHHHLQQQHQHNRPQHATYSPQKSAVKALAATTATTMASASATHTNNYNNDDEWSDFVSSAPPATAAPQFRTNAPQFNSAAWQNANFYNNPLSFYHQSQTSVVPNTNSNSNSNAFTQNKSQNNNNSNQYLSNYQQQPKQQQQHAPPTASTQQFQPQKIHIMKDFSTAAPSTQNTLRANASQHVNAASAYSAIGSSSSSQYQVGSAKVAPSISLIPDLGFVPPAIPAHTAFIHNLPKPSFQTKK